MFKQGPDTPEWGAFEPRDSNSYPTRRSIPASIRLRTDWNTSKTRARSPRGSYSERELGLAAFRADRIPCEGLGRMWSSVSTLHYFGILNSTSLTRRMATLRIIQIRLGRSTAQQVVTRSRVPQPCTRSFHVENKVGTNMPFPYEGVSKRKLALAFLVYFTAPFALVLSNVRYQLKKTASSA